MSDTKKLLENYNRILLESTREDTLSDIKFVKSLLGKDMNDENYENKTDIQLEIILDKYKNEFNNSGINKFTVGLVLFNINNDSGKAGFLADNNEVVERRKDALVFDSKKAAKDALDNYIIPEDYTLISNEIHRIKF